MLRAPAPNGRLARLGVDQQLAARFHHGQRIGEVSGLIRSLLG
jgi:hypothetical protein